MAIQNEGHITQLISVAGLPTCDLAYYMARVINAAGFRCLVIDNSKRKDLYGCIPKADEDIKLTQTGDIYYIDNVAYSEEFFSLYDYVIIYHGMLVDNELLEKSDIRYLQTDYLKTTTQKIRNILKTQKENYPFYLIYRDKAFSKIPEKLLLTEMNLGKKQIIESYEVFYNEQDYMHYIGLLRNGVTNIKSLSNEMKQILKDFLKIAVKLENEKEYKTIYKKFINGKIR